MPTAITSRAASLPASVLARLAKVESSRTNPWKSKIKSWGLNQRQAAMLLGISEASLSAYMCGIHRIPDDVEFGLRKLEAEIQGGGSCSPR